MKDINDCKRWVEVKTAMLLHVPFFASLLMDKMDVRIEDLTEMFKPLGQPPTAATNGKVIYFHQEFLEKLSLPEAVFVTCHEIGHAMWAHLDRGKRYLDLGFEGRDFNPRLWNVAGDYVINDMLVQSHVGRMPKIGLHDPKRFTHDMMVDDVYRELEKEKGNDDQSMDHHMLEVTNVTEAEWKRAAATAAEAAKAQGKLPAALERFVEHLLNPKVPWQEKLRTHVTRAISREATTWSRLNRRRLLIQNMVMPGYHGFGAGQVAVWCDTSGSVGEKELMVYLSELQSILDVAKPERLICGAIDAAVHDVTELSPGDSIADHPPPLKGGGGTDFRPAFEWMENEGWEPSCLIFFTDMYGSFPDTAPPYPVIWCSTSEGVAAPFGELIEVSVEEYQKEAA